MDIGAIESSGGISGIASQENIDKLAEQILQQLDKDGDGELSAEEASFPSEMLAQLDTDGNGSLNKAELSSGITTFKDTLFSMKDYASALNNGQSFDTEKFQSLMSGFSK